jgi:hypothetical protein
MKLVTRIVLFLFILSLSAPTIVRMIEKDSSISMFCDFSDEENSKDLKELKADLRVGFDYPFIESVINNTKIISENETRHDNLAEEIVIPPPEFI